MHHWYNQVCRPSRPDGVAPDSPRCRGPNGKHRRLSLAQPRLGIIALLPVGADPLPPARSVTKGLRFSLSKRHDHAVNFKVAAGDFALNPILLKKGILRLKLRRIFLPRPRVYLIPMHFLYFMSHH